MKKESLVLRHTFSEVTIHWDIPADMEEGHYRIRHMGYHRTILRWF